MNRMYRWSVALLGLSMLTVFQARADSITPEAAGADKAIAVMEPKSGSQVKGTVTFTKAKGGVRVVAEIEGLTPGQHGFHIHEKGDCSAADGSSAGGHFNPTSMPHGAPADAQRHAGDLGNLEANAQGKAKYDHVDSKLSLEGHDSIIGHSVIVHEKVDDLKTQPTGNAGGRVACGVISTKE